MKYDTQEAWKKLQGKLPEHNRITEVYTPTESFVGAGEYRVHLDIYTPLKKSKTTVIGFHGVGGNGRLLSFMAVPLVKAGYNVVCVDLPGYGLTECHKTPEYKDWIEVGKHIVQQHIDEGEEVFVFGLSAGGMVAYNVACECPNAKGLIATTLLDNREQLVRDYSAKNKLQARLGIPLLSVIEPLVQKVKVPMKVVCNMQALVNDKSVMKILNNDKVGAGNWVNLGLVISMMSYIPLLEPESFTAMPATLFHPAKDNWTPMAISELFFDRIASKKEKVLLENAGHFPLESPGLQQLEKAILDFISTNTEKV